MHRMDPMGGLQTFCGAVVYRSHPWSQANFSAIGYVILVPTIILLGNDMYGFLGGFSGFTKRDGWNFMDDLAEGYGTVVKLRDMFGVHFSLPEANRLCIHPISSFRVLCRRRCYMWPTRWPCTVFSPRISTCMKSRLNSLR